MEYINLIISFIVGGGISTLINLRFIKRASKIDYADKAIKFQEDQYDKVLKAYDVINKENLMLHSRISTLETQVNEILPIRCYNVNCKERKNVKG